MKTSSFFILVIAILSGFGVCRADTWTRADIYFIDWNVQVRVSLTPERVREIADSKRTFLDASHLVRVLALDKLKPTNDRRPEDARLVVDLFTDTGARVTYYASMFDLCTADNALKRSVDEPFRERFRRLVKAPF